MVHRLTCCWAKFHALQATLTDKDVPLKLRLNLFDAVVTPTVQYGLCTAPLTTAELRNLDVTQRCMLRRIVGWVCYDNDSWQERSKKMQARMQRALALHPIDELSCHVATNKEKRVSDICSGPRWTRLTYEWCSGTCATLNGAQAKRRRDRPRTKCV